MKYFCEYCECEKDDFGPYEFDDGTYRCQDCLEIKRAEEWCDIFGYPDWA